MALTIARPEVFGVSESSLTLAFAVEDGSGPVDAEARVTLDGEPRAISAGTAGTRLVRIEGLTLIYANALRVWLTDDTPDMAKTMAALDQGLRRAERLVELCRPRRRHAEGNRDSAA